VSAQLERSKPAPQIVGDNRQSQLPSLNHSFRFRFAERNRMFKFAGRNPQRESLPSGSISAFLRRQLLDLPEVPTFLIKLISSAIKFSAQIFVLSAVSKRAHSALIASPTATGNRVSKL